MTTNGRKPRLGTRLIQGLTDIRDTIKNGESLQEKFTVRTVILDLEPKDYRAEDIQQIRHSLGVSQALFAQMLGASADAVASWEQGIRTPSPMARRLLEEISRNQEHWRKLLRKGVTAVEH